uniref:Uncharacterized protein n=1 Tax=Ditylenchus dipsaci TaxID=166011 RepID=A0A915ES59_9BILA
MECKGRGQLTPQSLIMESSKNFLRVDSPLGEWICQLSRTATRRERERERCEECAPVTKETITDSAELTKLKTKTSKNNSQPSCCTLDTSWDTTQPAKIVDEEIEEEPAAEQEMDEGGRKKGCGEHRRI